MAPAPVDEPVHLRPDVGKRAPRREPVPDDVLALDDVDDLSPSPGEGELASVVGLPATGREECRLVDRQSVRLRVELDDGSGELAQIGIAQLEKLGHGVPASEEHLSPPVTLTARRASFETRAW